MRNIWRWNVFPCKSKGDVTRGTGRPLRKHTFFSWSNSFQSTALPHAWYPTDFKFFNSGITRDPSINRDLERSPCSSSVQAKEPENEMGINHPNHQQMATVTSSTHSRVCSHYFLTFSWQANCTRKMQIDRKSNMIKLVHSWGLKFMYGSIYKPRLILQLTSNWS